MTSSRSFAALWAIALGFGCVSSTADKGPEEDAPVDGTFDSFRSPIDHGEVTLGDTVTEELTSERSFHSWTFAVTEDATVRLETRAPEGGDEVDTMIYLYREGSTGWGRNIANNDDTKTSLFATLTRTLQPGHYRVLVKGYSRRSVGPFELEVGCETCGSSECLFGSTFNDLGSFNGLSINYDERFADLEGIFEPVQREQIVIAVQQSAHRDVTTAEEAMARIDGGVMRRLWLIDAIGSRTFLAYEYGAGGNSYGAIFPRTSTTVAASIRDGDLYECTPHPQQCVFGSTFHDLLADAGFTQESADVITTATTLDALTTDQLVTAVATTYTEVADLESALASVDAGVVNRITLREMSSGTLYIAYEFGAGDNSYGALVASESTDVVALIQDGGLDACAVLR